MMICLELASPSWCPGSPTHACLSQAFEIARSRPDLDSSPTSAGFLCKLAQARLDARMM